MEKDIFAIEYDRDEYKRKMNLVSQQLKEIDKRLKESQNNEQALIDKIKELEKSNISIRQMMTSQLTNSNEEKQLLLQKIGSLQQIIKELKNVNKG